MKFIRKATLKTWGALSGRGELLLADDHTLLIEAGDVVRFAEGDVHGVST